MTSKRTHQFEVKKILQPINISVPLACHLGFIRNSACADISSCQPLHKVVVSSTCGTGALRRCPALVQATLRKCDHVLSNNKSPCAHQSMQVPPSCPVSAIRTVDDAPWSNRSSGKSSMHSCLTCLHSATRFLVGA